MARRSSSIGKDGNSYVTVKPPGDVVTDNLSRDLIAKGVEVEAEPQAQSGFVSVLLSFLPFLLLIGVWIYFMNRMQGGGRGGAMGFGKSRAKLLTEKQGRVTFDDVAGIDEAKEELEEIVEFLRNPQKFSRLGGKIPKGALLVGPPGTGKTLLARAIAGEAGVPFFTISGSDFVEMFVGVGASRVRDMFEQAKKNAPCIVFIDEIDAVGRARGVGIGGGNDEREQTLNQLLVEMDGFEANEGVIIIAATNRKDVLDPALLRPGRFDRQIHVPNPDIKGREKILSVHARKVPLGPDVDLRTIARGSPGFSGADLMNLVNEAALMAARAGRRFVTMIDFESAKDKVMMGAERRSMVLTQDQKEMTAYHESGHAIVGMSLAEVRPGLQGDDHPARWCLGHGDEPAGNGPPELAPRPVRTAHRDDDGRQGCRDHQVGRGFRLERAVGRYPAGLGPGPRDGAALGDVGRGRQHRLCRGGGRLFRQHRGLLGFGRDEAPDRTGSEAPDRRGLSRPRAASCWRRTTSGSGWPRAFWNTRR